MNSIRSLLYSLIIERSSVENAIDLFKLRLDESENLMNDYPLSMRVTKLVAKY